MGVGIKKKQTPQKALDNTIIGDPSELSLIFNLTSWSALGVWSVVADGRRYEGLNFKGFCSDLFKSVYEYKGRAAAAAATKS